VEGFDEDAKGMKIGKEDDGGMGRRLGSWFTIMIEQFKAPEIAEYPDGRLIFNVMSLILLGM